MQYSKYCLNFQIMYNIKKNTFLCHLLFYLLKMVRYCYAFIGTTPHKDTPQEDHDYSMTETNGMKSYPKCLVLKCQEQYHVDPALTYQ